VAVCTLLIVKLALHADTGSNQVWV